MGNIQFRLSELMSRKNMTIADIERKSDIPITSVASILNGTAKNPTIKTLRSVAKALDISLEQLLSDDPNLDEH